MPYPYPPGAAPYPPGAVPYPYPPGAVPYPYGAAPYPYPPPGWPVPRPEIRWYGWQILIPGIISHVLTGTGALTGLLPVLIPGLAGSVFSAPIVHWSHGHGLRGLASLGIQFGATGLATGLWVVGIASESGGGIISGTAGGILIMGLALGLDAGLLGKEPVEPERPSARGGRPSFALAPLVPLRVDLRSGARPPTPAGLAVAGVF